MKLRLALALIAAAATSPTWAADDWVTMASISPTTTLMPQALCYTDGRDIACDGTAGLITAPNTPDRIVSGTTAAVIANQSGGTVSFTLGGTAGAAYLHPTIGLVVKDVSATHTIKGVYGYFSDRVGIGSFPDAPLRITYPEGYVRMGLGAYAIEGEISDRVDADSWGGWLSTTQNMTTDATRWSGGLWATAASNINAGVTNQGYLMGINAISFHASPGNLNILYGQRIQYGNHNKTGDPIGTVTNAYGINIVPYLDGGAITNNYGIYIGDVSATNNAFGIYQHASDNLNYFAGKVGIGNVSPTYPLTVNGTVRATAFVGDGSGLTGLSSVSDRITSGTTSVVANSTGTISLTTGGVTTGYFDTSGRLVVPAISATGTISGTDGYFSGSVGIGTTSPETPLDVSGSIIRLKTTKTGLAASSYLLFSSGDESIVGWVGDANSTSNMMGVYGKNGISLYALSTTPVMTVSYTSFGSAVGIGTTAPSSTLHVMGDISLGGGDNRFVQFRNIADNDHASVGEYNGGLALSGRSVPTPGYIDMFIDNQGRVGIGTVTPITTLDVSGTGSFTGSVTAASYYQSSDRRLKTNIETAGGLAVVDKLRGVTFNWKKDGKPSAGVIAQEVEKVMPSAVGINDQGMKTVNYDQLIAPLIEAVKELHRDNVQLRADFSAQIRALKAANDNLQAEVRAMRKEAR